MFTKYFCRTTMRAECLSNSIVYTIYGLHLFLRYFAVDVNKNKRMKGLIFFKGEILADFEKAVQTSD